jgi:hypothetical protein
MGIWLHTHTVTTIASSPDFGKLAEFLPDAGVQPCHYALIEAVEPFKLLCTFMAYIYERFEHLLRLLMNIWIHIHIITATDASPDL